MKRTTACLCFGLVCGLTLPVTCLAGGFHNEDVGTRRMGMLATVARVDDATAIFHNPAALTLIDGSTFYTSQSWFFVDLAFRLYDTNGVLRPDHEISPDWSVGAVPFFGATTDLGTEDWRLGVAVYAPNAYGAAMPDDEPTRYHATTVLFLSSRASLAVAWKPTEELAVAANINLVHMFLTAQRYMNASVLNNPDRRFDSPEDSAAGDHKLEIGGQAWTWSWDVGVLLTPLPNLRIGASFFAGTSADIEGDVILKYANSDKTEKTTQSTPMVIPFTLKAGINWEFVPGFEIGADYRYYHYQVFQEQRTKLKSPIMGIEEFRDPKAYSNSGNWCIGLRHRLTPELAIMVGYQEDYTPIPDTTYTLENPSRDQRGISLGVEWKATENHRFGLAMVRNWFNLVDVQTSQATPPTNVKGHGANFEIGFDWEWRFAD